MKEVTRLLEMCERQRVQDLLSQEQKKIKKELAQKQQQRENQAKRDSEDKADTTVKGYMVKINNYGVHTLIVLFLGVLCLHYTSLNASVNHSGVFFSIIGWDQSEKFVKVYITLKGVHKIPADNVQVSFTDRYVTCLNC